MGQRIGIIAGGGRFVPAAVQEFKKRGTFCVVAGVEGEASARLARTASVFRWINIGNPVGAVSFFRENGVDGVLLLGKVRHTSITGAEALGQDPRRFLAGPVDDTATVLLRAAAAFLESQGLRVLDPGPLLRPYFCDPGPLTRSPVPEAAAADIEFGLPLARRLADLDIGQTLVVRRGAVAATEGLEGTDAAIRRGARLAGPGFSVVKAGRTSQDLRFDVPAVGLDTVRAIVRARGSALAIDAGKVAFFQRSEAVGLADRSGLAIVALAAAGEKGVPGV